MGAKSTRRQFLATTAGAVGAVVLPSTPHPPYHCSCRLVYYEWQGEHYAASHIVHRKPRMWMLIEIAKHRKLSVDERDEIQRAFIAVGANDARMRESE